MSATAVLGNVEEFSPPFTASRTNYKPTHEGLFHVEFEEGDFSSRLVTDRAFAAGETLAPIQGTIPGRKAYSSVQVRADPAVLPGEPPASAENPVHIELCSDLLYVNHSCEPNVAFDVSTPGAWHVRALRDIPAGTALSFLYVSTEWDMAQPFTCLCGTASCLGEIRGAKYVPRDFLEHNFVNKHILQLKDAFP